MATRTIKPHTFTPFAAEDQGHAQSKCSECYLGRRHAIHAGPARLYGQINESLKMIRGWAELNSDQPGSVEPMADVARQLAAIEAFIIAWNEA
jgi:hypothetical protein